MDALVGALVLFLLGLLGGRFSFTTARSVPGARFLFIAGTHFLFVGLLLASPPVHLLTPAVQQSLYPLLALAIGWVGLLFGMQLDVRQLRVFPAGLIALAMVQAVVAFLFFAGVAYAVLRSAGPLDRPTHAALGAAAATACISSPLGVALTNRLVRAKGRLPELLLFVASLDALVGVVAIQLIYAVYHPLEAAGGFQQRGGLEWFAMALAVGVMFGILFVWLVRARPTRDELAVFLLGLALFIAGAALYLGVSALFVAVVAGLVITNVSPLGPRIYEQLRDWEKPIYVVLLVLLGAMLEFDTWLVVPFALGYTLLRVLGKLTGGWVAGRLLPASERPRADFGLGLIAQSGMPLALALSVALSQGSLSDQGTTALQFLVNTVVLAVVASEFIGPALTRGVLRRDAATVTAH